MRVLRGADRVLAEDTRRTRQLLTHLGIRGAALSSFHEHNERGKQEQARPPVPPFCRSPPHTTERTRWSTLTAGSEAHRRPQVLRELRMGRALALVSDAGMPAVSDPGAALVRKLTSLSWPCAFATMRASRTRW